MNLSTSHKFQIEICYRKTSKQSPYVFQVKFELNNSFFGIHKQNRPKIVCVLK